MVKIISDICYNCFMGHRLFIAYHGSYDQNGSLTKAEELYRYLTEHGVDCFLYSQNKDEIGIAFSETPEIANECEKFILVCNEHIRTDENGKVANNGVYRELKAFWNQIYYGNVGEGDATVYCFGKFSSSMAKSLYHCFQGIEHFSEMRNNGQNCFDKVLEWVNSPANDLKGMSITDRYDDIRSDGLELVLRKGFGLSARTFSEDLLPHLEYEGGEVIDNILTMKLERGRTYIISANGGSGKSTSLKSLWVNTLQKDWLPVYVSIRSCYEKYGDREHPVYEYLAHTYAHFHKDVNGIPDYLKQSEVRWLFLFDGYNEAENLDKINEDINNIDLYITSIVTTRDRSFTSGLDNQDIMYLKMLPLDEETVRNYITSFSNKNEITDLISNANMLMMLNNPMLLTMFCNSFDAADYNKETDGKLDDLTPGELIEKCVTAQLRNTHSVSARQFFMTLCLFPMSIAAMYYDDKVTNMAVSRMDLRKAVIEVMKSMDISVCEEYLFEYCDKWGMELGEDEYEELLQFLQEAKPVSVNKEMTAFENVMSTVLEFFNSDNEKSRVGGSAYHFAHQTSFNWFIAYGIYRMAELMPERFETILDVITENMDSGSESSDDYEEQGELLFDLIRDSLKSETYRKFIRRLHEIHFQRRTPRIYDIATDCIRIFDASKVSDEEYSDAVASCCFSLYSNTPKSKDIDKTLEIYGKKLEPVLKRAERIKDPEVRAIRIAKINTIQGAWCLGMRTRAAKRKEPKEVLHGWAKKAEEYHNKALITRNNLLMNEETDYRYELMRLIPYCYTELGTDKFYQADYDTAVIYQTMAYEMRKEISEDETYPEEIRHSCHDNLPVNLNRINGGLLRMKDRLTSEDVKQIFKRELEITDTDIVSEIKDQINHFKDEIDLIGLNKELFAMAKEIYEKISLNYVRRFGYLNDKVIEVREKLALAEYKISEVTRRIKEAEALIASEPFQTIVRLFNNGEAEYDIEKINALAENWDYRKKMANGGERQDITVEDPFVGQHRDIIIDCFRKLDLLDDPVNLPEKADYVLPLGGYGNSNYRRCELAEKLVSSLGETPLKIVALSCFRDIEKEDEFNSIRHFAPSARTEFDEMDMAMRKAFGLSQIVNRLEEGTPGTKEYWCQLEYESDDIYREYYNLSAPCKDPNRTRANTIATFEHFLDRFHIKRGTNVVLVSTSLYRIYQTYSLLPAAIEHGVNLSYIGCYYHKNDDDILATLCLCELKGGVNSIYNLMKKYR